MRVRCREFRAWFLRRWSDVFEEVCAFAAEVGKDRLINISQGGWRGVITVWYWSDE